MLSPNKGRVCVRADCGGFLVERFEGPLALAKSDDRSHFTEELGRNWRSDFALYWRPQRQRVRLLRRLRNDRFVEHIR
jgi:hypothetical protein